MKKYRLGDFYNGKYFSDDEIKEVLDFLQCYLHESILSKGFMNIPVPIPEQCALIHSEVSEALEAFRNKEPISWTDKDGKPQGLASEYIDVLIRVFNYCSHMDINIADELKRKHEYNEKRAFMHGGKVI